MRASTRRSVSRVAVFGLLATTPLIAGWAAVDSDDDTQGLRTSARHADTGSDERAAGPTGELDAELAAASLAASGGLERSWLDVAPAVHDNLRGVDAMVAAGGVSTPTPALSLRADELAAIDTSEVTVTVLGDEEPAAYVTADGESITAARVRAFLDGRNAPMAEQAETIVAAGIAHDVDPRVVVGIAIAESNAGERLPAGSHNAWGWGGSGKFGLAHWDSWDESIDTYTERLGALYDTDDVDRAFAETYCPPNWRWWLDTVTWVIDEI